MILSFNRTVSLKLNVLYDECQCGIRPLFSITAHLYDVGGHTNPSQLITPKNRKFFGDWFVLFFYLCSEVKSNKMDNKFMYIPLEIEI